jgi:hypothetical protein
MYYMGFTYSEAYRLPLWQRKWFIDRINKEFTRANESGEQSMSRAAHANDPESRSMMGMSRAQSPARLRRFT